MITAEEVVKPYVEKIMRHTEVVEKDNAITAMNKFADQFRLPDVIQRVTGKRKDNDEYVTGSLMYDFDQDCWRIITHFFDIEEPKQDNQFGICAHEVYLDTVEQSF